MRIARPSSHGFSRGIDLREFAHRLETSGTSGRLTSPEASYCVGKAEPIWHLDFGQAAETKRITQFTIASDYLEGRLAASGSQRHILPLRHHLPFGVTPSVAASAIGEYPKALLASHRKSVIENHYDRPDEFFLTFLDREYHLYSQGHFRTTSDTLESAAARKVGRIADEFRSIGAERILDVGCGWGGVTTQLAQEFDVTALTLGERSYQFTKKRLESAQAHGRVVLQDALSHTSPTPYDGAAILGVFEHLPEYGRFFARLARLVRPGGRIYADCASSRSRLAMNPFVRKHIWTGTHGFVNLPAMLKHAQENRFRVIEVVNETNDYAETMAHWADRFSAERERIERLTSQADFRAFEMYLYGGEESLRRGTLQAYRLVLERQEDR